MGVSFGGLERLFCEGSLAFASCIVVKQIEKAPHGGDHTGLLT